MVIEKILDFYKNLNQTHNGDVALRLVSDDITVSSFNVKHNSITLNVKNEDIDYLTWVLCHEYKHYLQHRDNHYSMRERTDILKFSLIFYGVIVPAVALIFLMILSLFITIHATVLWLFSFYIIYFSFLIKKTTNISSIALFQNDLRRHSHILEYEADEFATTMTNYIPLFLDTKSYKINQKESVTHPAIEDRLHRMKQLIVIGNN